MVIPGEFNVLLRSRTRICVTWQDRASLRDEQKAIIKFIAEFKFSEILIYLTTEES